MANDRKPIPKAVQASILIACRRRCCLCWFWDHDESQKDGQIAHVDRNPANNSAANLVYLCLEHHSQYDSTGTQAKRTTPDEVRHARTQLLKALASSRETSVTVTFRLALDSESFSDDDEKRILGILRQYCRPNSEIELLVRAPGSVLLNYRFEPKDALRVLRALDAGDLKQANVVDGYLSNEPPEFKYDVFLSYSSKDSGVIRMLAERLKTDGLRIWYDEWAIAPGDSIPLKVERGLEESRTLILCMSSNYFASEWAAFQRAAFQFRDPTNVSRRFIPLLLDDAKIPASLGQFRFVDWRTGRRNDAAYAELRAAVGVRAKLMSVSTGHGITIYAPDGRRHELPWNLPAMSISEARDVSLEPLGWTTVQRLCLRLFTVLNELKQQMTQAAEGRGDYPESFGTDLFTSLVDEQATELARFPRKGLRLAFLRQVADIRLCLPAIRRSLCFPPNSKTFAEGLILVDRMCEWLLEAMHRSALIVESQLSKNSTMPRKPRRRHARVRAGDASRAIVARPAGAPAGLQVFYSYSHKDEKLRGQLDTHLKLLQRDGLIYTWHDRCIPPGGEWGNEIDGNIRSADVILLLVSADFIASDYCFEKEVRLALQRHEKGQAVVIPVLLRKCVWDSAPFSKLQALPSNGRAVTLWPDRDTAWTDIAEGIRAIAKNLHSPNQ